MTKLERIQNVINHWFNGELDAPRALSYIKRIMEDKE